MSILIKVSPPPLLIKVSPPPLKLLVIVLTSNKNTEKALYPSKNKGPLPLDVFHTLRTSKIGLQNIQTYWIGR